MGKASHLSTAKALPSSRKMRRLQLQEIPVRLPFNATALLDYLKARAMPGVEQVSPGVYTRVARARHGLGVVSIDFSQAQRGLLLATSDVIESADETKDVVETITAAGMDVRPIEAHLSTDTRLKPLVRRQTGLRVPGTSNPFELAVRAILGQQISVARAATLATDLVLRFGPRLQRGRAGGLSRAFPAPDNLVAAPIEELGVPKVRARAIRTLASMILDGQLSLRRGASPGPAREALLAIHGIGPWTASYVSLRALGDFDAIPTGDLGLRQVMGSPGAPLSTTEFAGLAEPWRPWRGFAASHLWTTLLPA